MDLKLKAKQLRTEILIAAANAGRGHLGGALSCLDILVTLYYKGFLDNNNFILSKGHSAIALYAILDDLGKLKPRCDLSDFCQPLSPLAEHPSKLVPGVLVTTGSLGHGLGIATGMALADKLDGNSRRTYVLVGDGECDEGSTWEALRFAGERELSNLHMIVDYNRLRSTDQSHLEGFPTILTALGWIPTMVDGHNYERLAEAFNYVPIPPFRHPRAYIASTVKGKGISFMEYNARWHSGVPKGILLQKALQELL